MFNIFIIYTFYRLRLLNLVPQSPTRKIQSASFRTHSSIYAAKSPNTNSK